MDILEATNDLQDWELLHANSDSDSAPVNSAESVNSLDEIDDGGLIQTNYFSLDAQNRYGVKLDDEKSAESDNPSWIDPGMEENPTRYLNKESGEYWSDSSSERSDERKLIDLDGRNDLGFSGNEEKALGFRGIEEHVEEKGEMEGPVKSYSGSSETEDISAKLDDSVENSEFGVGSDVNLRSGLEAVVEQKDEIQKIGPVDEVVGNGGVKKSGEIGKRGVWWKMPMEFLKYCVFRMSPVWSVSVAAAVMGFVILGRRLYKMKKKTRGLQIKVTVDDKKVSQVMSRAARLNEAFSVVKRVPVIRPALPAVGSTPWPVMSLR